MTETLESELYRAKIVQEKKRRDDWRTRVRNLAFPAQLAFISDPSKLKAARCTRRAAKSTSFGIDCLDLGFTEPDSNFLYLGLTGDSALAVIWGEVLKPLSEKLGVKLGLSEHKKRIRIGSSTLYYAGIEDGSAEFSKLLGRKYKRIGIDEAASITSDLRKLIHSDLLPATIDVGGTIAMFAAPNDYDHTYYYEVTTGQVPGWSLHHWSALDNPHVAKQFRAEMDRLKAENPLIEETPWYKQQMLGQWAIDDSKLCYKFRADRNLYQNLYSSNQWRYLQCIDLGWDDASGFVIAAFRDYDKKLYYPFAYKRSGMTISDVAAYSKELDKRFPPYRKIIDGSNKQAVEELKQRHGMHNLEAAEKAGKADFIHLMNNDFILGDIQAHETDAAELINEWKSLTWNEKLLAKGKYEELASKPNHLADPALYGWRYALNWIDRGVEANLNKSVDERMEDQWEAEAERSMSDIGKPFYEREENAWE